MIDKSKNFINPIKLENCNHCDEPTEVEELKIYCGMCEKCFYEYFIPLPKGEQKSESNFIKSRSN